MFKSNCKLREKLTKNILINLRGLFSKTGKWPITCTFDHDHSCLIRYLKNVEKHWKTIIKLNWKTRLIENESNYTKYILSMFPYPSGSLHLGHVRVYTTADIIAKFNHLNGDNVILPMGWDSFGLPAENAAFTNKLDPKTWTNKNIDTMKEQFNSMSLYFNEREATSDENFFKWTQWLFVKMFENNLAYRSRAKVNWDPIDCTVLANEQVDENGRSWRSGALVEKKYLQQWFIKLSPFVEELYNGVDVDLTENGVNFANVLDQQRKWMEKPDSYSFYITLESGDVLQLFSDRPEYFLLPDSYVLLAADHWLTKFPNLKIINPFNGKILLTKIDNENRLDNNALLLNDSNKQLIELREKVFNTCKENKNLGGYFSSKNFFDWTVSRQRYWGTPIPVIICDQCGIQSVPVEQLPVRLPEIENTEQLKYVEKSLNTEPISRLAKIAPKNWLQTECPNCKKPARRETDTLDTFFDSSWYYLRYAVNASEHEAFNKEKVAKPIWLYIGGEEHTTGHLLYARLVYKFLRSINLISSETSEPFKSILLNSVVTGKTIKLNGAYISEKEFEKLKETGKQIKKQDLQITYEKMSKSKGKGVDPNFLIEKYGVDATRLCVIGYRSPGKVRRWNGEKNEYNETLTLLRRLILTFDQFIYMKQLEQEKRCGIKFGIVRRFKVTKLTKENLSDVLTQIVNERQALVEKVTKLNLNIVYSANVGKLLFSFIHNVIRKYNLVEDVALTIEFERCLADVIIMFSPILPHLSHELWHAFAKHASPELNQFYNLNETVYQQRWPIK